MLATTVKGELLRPVNYNHSGVFKTGYRGEVVSPIGQGNPAHTKRFPTHFERTLIILAQFGPLSSGRFSLLKAICAIDADGLC